MNRIEARFAQLKRDGQKAFVVYIGAGDPHLEATRQLALAFDRAGVDGLLVLDLPPEEADTYEQLMRNAGLCAIWLVAPTTPDERISTIVKRGTGFIYYISREGVTGMQAKVAGNLADRVALIRKHTALPIAIGFGISNPEQARQVAFAADGAVVGSAVVNQIAQLGKSPDLVPKLEAFVKSLGDGVKGK
jgi:tryptophan synthase alpha chain